MASLRGTVPLRDRAWVMGTLVAVVVTATGYVAEPAILAAVATFSLVPLAVAAVGSLPEAADARRYRWILALTAVGVAGLVPAIGWSRGPAAAAVALPWFAAGVGVAALGYRLATTRGIDSPADRTLALGLFTVPVGGLLLALDRAGLAVAGASGPIVDLAIPDRTLSIAALAHLLAVVLVAGGLLGRWIAATGRNEGLAGRTYRAGATLVVLGSLALVPATWLSPSIQAIAFLALTVGGIPLAALSAVLPFGKRGGLETTGESVDRDDGVLPGDRRGESANDDPPTDGGSADPADDPPSRWSRLRRILGRIAVLAGGLTGIGLLAFLGARAGYGALTGSPVDLPAFLAGLSPWLVAGPPFAWLVGWRIGLGEAG